MGDKNAEADMTISGQILIPRSTPALHGASARISLEGLRGEDAPAAILAETVIKGLKHEPGNRDTAIPFTVRVAPDKIAPKHDYAMRVWIDRDSDGKPGPGDLHSDERHSNFFDRPERPITIKVA
jgi:uncharacterized lipoprotein YbaY